MLERKSGNLFYIITTMVKHTRKGYKIEGKNGTVRIYTLA